MFTKSKHLEDGFAAFTDGKFVVIIGSVKKDAPYFLAKNMELVTSPTLEELKATLTERGLKFKEPTLPN